MAGERVNWPRVAEKLAAAIPAGRLHPAVVVRIADSAPRERLAVALSGGADSVALLLLLWAHFPERRAGLLALHFDHRLRGRASGGDARFCMALCRALGVELVAGRWADTPAKRGRTISEGAARAARQEFFRATLRRRRTTLLCTGHHRDDVAETLLMRLARGSGAGGLSAPRPVHPQPSLGRTHLRPLLPLDKSEIVAALSAAGARWRNDASNASDAYFRNRIREEVVPVWRAAAETGRDALSGLALSRELLEEDDDALEQWADQLMLAATISETSSRGASVDAKASRASAGLALDLARLRESPRAVLRRIVHRWLVATPVETDLNRAGFAGLLEFVASGRAGSRFSLGRKYFAAIRRGRLVCEPGGHG